MGKNESIFKLMFKDKFSHHVDEIPHQLRKIHHEMAERGLSISSAALNAYARAANDRKKAIADEIEPLLSSFWKGNKDKNINLGKLAAGEAQAIFERLDKYVKAKLKKPPYNNNVPGIQETYDELNQETEKALQKILNKAEIVVAGFGPTQSVGANNGGNHRRLGLFQYVADKALWPILAAVLGSGIVYYLGWL